MDIVEQLRKFQCPENKGCNSAVEYCQCALMDSGADEIERLREALKLAFEMRQAQKTYFKDRNQQNLIASKQAEKAFDTALQQKDSE